jgi:pantoate--beta-alanine ligase
MTGTLNAGKKRPADRFRHRNDIAPLRLLLDTLGRRRVARMLVARSTDDLQAACTDLRQLYGALALVPTMGALHAGHRALVKAARASGAAVAVSIFVNPLQFGPSEDLTRYPRDEQGDLAALREEQCDLAWLPQVAALYPSDSATTIEVAGPALRWEGDHRPGHFRGVATVVAKLFGLVRPDAAYFGEKDWQQLQVVRRMVQDLHLPVRIIGVPTVREADGLALSSRNRFLTHAERALAPGLYRELRRTADALRAGGKIGPALDAARAALAEAGFSVDYLAATDATTLEPLSTLRPPARLLAAARLGSVRLLDNVPL